MQKSVKYGSNALYQHMTSPSEQINNEQVSSKKKQPLNQQHHQLRNIKGWSEHNEQLQHPNTSSSSHSQQQRLPMWETDLSRTGRQCLLYGCQTMPQPVGATHLGHTNQQLVLNHYHHHEHSSQSVHVSHNSKPEMPNPRWYP